MAAANRARRKGEPAVKLVPSLDLTAAAPLAAELLSRRGKPLSVDASEVEKLGGQCLQVLLSAAATWKADGHSLSIDNPSDAFAAGLQLFGLSLDHITHKEQLA